MRGDAMAVQQACLKMANVKGLVAILQGIKSSYKLQVPTPWYSNLHQIYYSPGIKLYELHFCMCSYVQCPSIMTVLPYDGRTPRRVYNLPCGSRVRQASDPSLQVPFALAWKRSPSAWIVL